MIYKRITIKRTSLASAIRSLRANSIKYSKIRVKKKAGKNTVGEYIVWIKK